MHFNSDYMEGAHPAIIKRLTETNLEQTVGYGKDQYTQAACEKIKEACECPTAEVVLLVGGTQANATVIKSVKSFSDKFNNSAAFCNVLGLPYNTSLTFLYKTSLSII